MTEDEALMVVAVLSAAFPHAKGGGDTVVVYRDSLLDLEYENAERAVRSLILTEKEYMPSIAKIRERAIELRDGGRRTGVEAWGSVIRAMKAKGSHRTPGVDFVFNDPITSLVVQSLGWAELCAGDADNLMASRARFVQAYDQISVDDAKSRQAGGLLPERISAPTRQLGSGAWGDAVRIGDLIPRPNERMPWEDE